MILETEPDPGSAQAPSVTAPRLHVASPRPALLPLTPTRDGQALGKAFFQDRGIENPRASGTHARVLRNNQPVRIVDDGSRNGTFVNGDRLEKGEEVTLTEGTVVRIGNAVMVYREGKYLSDEPALSPHVQDDRDRGGQRTVFMGPFALPALSRRIASLGADAARLRRVLLRGETGTGKETVARWVATTVRPRRDVVALNAAQLRGDTAMTELFGHARGAFSGAVSAKQGAFEQADDGVLFLDEIADVPSDVQPALLRACDPGDIRRVGADRDRRVDVLVIAASAVLEDRVRADRFRRDLYERLMQAIVEIPPLRARREDIPSIAWHLLDREGPGQVEPDAVEALLLHAWPGNVRELDRVVAETVRAGGLAKAVLPKDVLAREAWPSESATRGRVVAETKRLKSDAKAAAYLGMTESMVKRLRGEAGELRGSVDPCRQARGSTLAEAWRWSCVGEAKFGFGRDRGGVASGLQPRSPIPDDAAISAGALGAQDRP